MPFDHFHSRRLALIAIILQNASPLKGRIKLQKIAYLVNLCGWHCFTDFKFHYYGPYSETLVKEIEGMKDNEWVLEAGFSTNNNRVFYQYSVRKEKLADLLISRINDPALVLKTAGLVKQLNEFDPDDLEIMSSLVFLKNTQPTLDEDALVETAQNLKPRFTEEQIRQNTRIFKILKPFLSIKR